MTTTQGTSPQDTSPQDASPWTPAAKLTAAVLLAVWAGIAYLLGSSGTFVTPEPQVFLPVAISAVVPVAIFIAAYGLLPGFRRFVLAQDLYTLTVLQLWRVVGFGFLLLYAYHVLPALFAWPAGIGDLAVGLTAPLVAAQLLRNPENATNGRLVRFHALGLLDFAIAIGASFLASGAFPAILSGPITSDPMSVWPLNIFPSFGVPIFIMMHLTVFLKVAALRRAAAGQPVGALRAAA